MGLLKRLQESVERDQARAQAQVDAAVAHAATVSAARVKAMIDAGLTPEEAGRAEAARQRALDSDGGGGGGAA